MVRKLGAVAAVVAGLLLLVYVLNLPLRPGFNRVLEPVGISGNRVAETLRLGVADVLGVSSQSQRQQQQEITRLRLEQLELEQLREENQQLRQELDFARESELKSLQADVINYNPDPTRNFLRINRGSNGGVEPGMSVVADGVLLGVVEEVSASTADIKLASDINFRALARTESGVEGVIKGQVGGGVMLDQLPREQGIDTGELVYTSGQDGTHPPRILIGTIRSLAQTPGEVFDTAHINPEISYQSLQVVSVITES